MPLRTPAIGSDFVGGGLTLLAICFGGFAGLQIPWSVRRSRRGEAGSGIRRVADACEIESGTRFHKLDLGLRDGSSELEEPPRKGGGRHDCPPHFN
jgi:hypothetical protein